MYLEINMDLFGFYWYRKIKILLETLLCPTNVVTAKLSNKYIQLILQIRKNLDEVVPALNNGLPGGTIYSNIFFDETDET